MKPYAESADQNKAPILEVLREVFADRRRVLEIGSGTGQHAIHFARHLPHLTWLPTDLAQALPGIRFWVEEAALPNVEPPRALDVTARVWDVGQADAVFSANTIHIISMDAVRAMFAGVGRTLETGGLFAVYGPFNYAGEYTSASNARFDEWLKARDPGSGLKDVEDLNALAGAAGMTLMRDFPMPVNNRTLVWRRS